MNDLARLVQSLARALLVREAFRRFPPGLMVLVLAVVAYFGASWLKG